MTLLLSQTETPSKGKKGGNAEPFAQERQRRALCSCHAYASHARTRSPWPEHNHGETTMSSIVFYVVVKATLTPRLAPP